MKKKKVKKTRYDNLTEKVAVIWTRVSTDRQEKENCSLDTRKREILEFAQRYNIRIKDSFGGEHESAATEGKKFNAMINYVKKDPEVNIILVWNYSRFSRTGAKGILLKDELKDMGKYVIAVREFVNPDSAVGQFTEDIKFIFNKLGNSQRREASVAGMKSCISKGYWYSKPPYGYSKKKIEKGVHKVWVNEKGKILRNAWVWKAEGVREVDICNRLNALGLKIDRKHLCKILQNRFYCGYINHSLLDEEIKGKQEILIDEDTWNIANGFSKAGTYEQSRIRKEYPLKRHIKCACCGKHLTGYEVKARGKHYYKCNTIGCRCNESIDKMHNLYLEQLDGITIPRQLLPIMSDMLKKYFKELDKEKWAMKSQLLKSKTEIETQIENVKIKFGLGKINDDVYQVTIEHLSSEKAKINQEILKTEIDLSNMDKNINDVLVFVCNLRTCWNEGSYFTRQKIQNLVFPEGIMWDEQNQRYRTIKVNEAISVLDVISDNCKDGKEEATTDSALLSPSVGMRRLERPTPTSRT